MICACVCACAVWRALSQLWIWQRRSCEQHPLFLESIPCLRLGSCPFLSLLRMHHPLPLHPPPSQLGITTMYNFWAYPDKTRLRLSQILVLPPYQEAGLGKRMVQVRGCCRAWERWVRMLEAAVWLLLGVEARFDVLGVAHAVAAAQQAWAACKVQAGTRQVWEIHSPAASRPCGSVCGVPVNAHVRNACSRTHARFRRSRTTLRARGIALTSRCVQPLPASHEALCLSWVSAPPLKAWRHEAKRTACRLPVASRSMPHAQPTLAPHVMLLRRLRTPPPTSSACVRSLRWSSCWPRHGPSRWQRR